MKKIVILGSTGSIGTQALEVVKAHPDAFRIVGLAAGSNIELLSKQVHNFEPLAVSVADAHSARKLRALMDEKRVQVDYGENGLIHLATMPEADLVLVSMSGTNGLIPTIEAIKMRKQIALATKEILVMAGDIIMKEAKKHGVSILPVDSEHSAVFQCLQGSPMYNVRRLILTSSGGPFRGKKPEDLTGVTVEQALKHPNWSMGKKITIDSATLMNKGLEVLEAKWLFDIALSNIDVIVHPQSIVHSMVEFKDGSVLAQMAIPDMKIPIQYAFSYPERLTTQVGSLNFAELKCLTFELPDVETFKSLTLAYKAGEVGGSMPAVLTRANDAAVELFLNKRISFLEIPAIVQSVMEEHVPRLTHEIYELIEAGEWAYNRAYDISRGR